MSEGALLKLFKEQLEKESEKIGSERELSKRGDFFIWWYFKAIKGYAEEKTQWQSSPVIAKLNVARQRARLLSENIRLLVRKKPAPYLPPEDTLNVLNDKTRDIVKDVLKSLNQYHVEEKFVSALNDYLIANTVLVSCLLSRCRMTREIRSRLHESLLEC